MGSHTAHLALVNSLFEDTVHIIQIIYCPLHYGGFNFIIINGIETTTNHINIVETVFSFV